MALSPCPLISLVMGAAVEGLTDSAAGRARRRRWVTIGVLAVWGPGLVVMLADTDAGSLITAAQSGASWRYAMVLPEVLLIPILFVVQDAVVRLGVTTGKGHGQLIREHFGLGWGLVSALTLFASSVGALLTEFVGVAGVGELFGLSKWLTVPVATAFLVGLAFTRSYRRVERVALALGLAELAFIPAMLATHPNWTALAHRVGHLPLAQHSFLVLLAANVGAVIMPWMVFYQQEAVIDKGRRTSHIRTALRAARLNTAIGAIVTQVVMIAIVVAVAATIGTTHPGASLNNIGDIAAGLTPFLGHHNAVLFFGLGMLGAATVAALVVCLAGAWGVAEVLGWKHSLNDSPRRAAGFYSLAVTATLSGALLVMVTPNLVNLSVDVEVLNACLLPVVLGFLLLLERRALPVAFRMHGIRRLVTYSLTGVVMTLGLYTGFQALTGRL